jgi:hypothetical protein
MGYSGFIQNPIEVVQRLRNDLGDRYKRGFPVLKELVQNADDAYATHVIFGIASGIPEAEHPLLKGDGLFVVNNGVFEDKHDRGIRSYGMSNKVADRAAVGKFGLGMKSVFHFCEAFFFLGQIGDRSISRIVNPWSVPAHLVDAFPPVHPSWESFTSNDAERMRLAISEATAGLPPNLIANSFILWLPLRRNDHRIEDGESTGVIVQEFPGDGDGSLAFLQDPALPMQVADLLPLLRHIREIRFLPRADTRFSPFNAEVMNGAERLLFIQEPGKRSLNGQILIHGFDQSTGLARFLGQETHDWIDDLRILHGGPYWPETTNTDDRGRPTVERDKAEPHAAVVLTSAPALTDRGSVTIRWAVFLPLEESLVSQVLPCGGDRDFCFTLHGHFFVDAGRRGIHGFDVLGKGQPDEPVDSVDAVRIGWNQQLATKGTLPLLLPVLHQYVSSLKPAQREDTGRLLARALSESWLWSHFRNSLTTSGQWVLGLRREGPGWQLVDRDRPLLPLPPSIERDRERPWRVFPALDQLEASCDLVVSGTTQLSSHPVYAPDLSQIETLLLSVDASVTLRKKSDLAYLADTLELVTGSNPLQPDRSQIWRPLLALLRDGLQQIGLIGIRANRPEIVRLAAFVPADVTLALPDSVPGSLLDRLMRCPLDLLVVPSDLSPHAPETQSALTARDAEQLLRVAADWIEEDPKHATHRQVLKEVQRLLGLVKETSRPELLRTLGDLDLIYAFDGTSMAWRAVPFVLVEKAWQSLLLFRRGQVADDQGLALARPLQCTLTENRVVVLENEMLVLLGLNDKAVMSCDSKGVLHTLGSRPHSLRAPAARLDLVRQLPDPGNDDTAKRGLRFLLHGKEGRWSDLETPLWYRDAELGTAWELLWSQLNEDWNLIDAELAIYVSDPVRRRLGVQRIQPAELIETLGVQGVGRIDPSAFTSQECTEILSETHDEIVWRMLPLHECKDGSRHDARGSNVYLDQGLSLPDRLAGSVRLIRPSTDDTLWHRQQKLLEPFGREARLKLLLESPEPHQSTLLILDDIAGLKRDLDPEEQALVAQTTWLPNHHGNNFAPRDIIDCEDPSGLIRDLASQATEGTYTAVGLLPSRIINHPGFERMRQQGLLAQGEDALETLGLLIGELPDYHLGEVEFDEAVFPSVVAVLAGLASRVGLPGWALLEGLTKDHKPERIVTLVAHEMARERPEELRTILDVFDGIRALGQADQGRRAAFEMYLRRFAELPEAQQKVAGLSLIDSGGHWRQARELCAGAEDIDRRFVLCETQHRILSNLVHAAGDLPGDRLDVPARTQPVAGAALAELLQGYFGDWQDKVPEALVGCFVFVCATDSAVKALVERYRGNRISLRDWLLDKLPWRPKPDRQSQEQTWADLYWKTPEEALDGFTVSAVLVPDDTVMVTSLLGEPLNVQRASSPKSFVTVRRGGDQIFLQMTPIDASQYPASRLTELLRRSIEAVLSTQIKPKRHPGLVEAFKRFENARAQVVEYSGHARAAEFEEQKREALLDIQRMIEDDSTAREALLHGVRNKMRDYQYKPESIPFELFQNADDAVRERREIDEYVHSGASNAIREDTECDRFVVHADSGTVTFMHWGRPLNSTGDPFPGRDFGYHRDLDKMLIVSASDKERPSTGKFGLGFKSVFLGCEEPHMVSGRLSVRILGGMLPMPLEQDEPLRKLLREFGPIQSRAGTAIRLVMSPDGMTTILDRFRAMGGILCCFAKAIRQIDLANDISHTWQPSILGFAPAVGIGDLKVPSAKDGTDSIRVLRFDLNDGALLFGLNGQGVCRLPETVPTLWILAPTAEEDALGFAINGPFDVDAGRTRLADSDELNLSIADGLGRRLFDVLTELNQGIAQDWENARHALRLNPGVVPYDFWYSLWQTLVGGLQLREKGKVRSLAQRIAQGGIGAFAKVHPVIPNGLPGQYRDLLRVGDVRVVFRGALARTDVLEHLYSWDEFAEDLVAQNTVCQESHEWVSLVDNAYGSARAQWKSLKLADLPSRLMDDHRQVRVQPGPAEVWGSILNTASQDDLPKDQRDDLDSTARVFVGACYLSASGTFSPAAELLDPSGDSEEQMRWAFAPDTHRLSPDYSDVGKSLLRRSRGPTGFTATAQLLAQWIRALKDDPVRRAAALCYLRDGERASHVINKLHEMGIKGSWIAALTPDDLLFRDWARDETIKLLAQFMRTEQLEPLFQEPTFDIGVGQMPVDVTRTLEQLHQWWTTERVQRIERYEQHVYPGGKAPVDALLYEDESLFTGDRSAWLTLFLLGNFHTLGLVGHAQNRGFIEMCQQRHWWQNVFVKPDPHKNPDGWMRVLDEYIDAQTDQQPYEYWMQRFPAIYRLARYLDDYRDLMLGLPTWKWTDGECRLDQVTKPRVTPRLQGGGINAPPFHATLGAGACFVVRELLRLGIVTGEHLPHACAYVPTKGIRDLFARWGYSEFASAGSGAGLSTRIHQILSQHMSKEGARFCGDYDIALQVMAYQSDVEACCTAYKA